MKFKELSATGFRDDPDSMNWPAVGFRSFILLKGKLIMGWGSCVILLCAIMWQLLCDRHWTFRDPMLSSLSIILQFIEDIDIFKWFYEPSFLHLLLSREALKSLRHLLLVISSNPLPNLCLIAWNPRPFTSILFVLTFLSNSSEQWRLQPRRQLLLLAGW